MDVAALQTVSNISAFGELADSQDDLSGAFDSGGGFETGDMKGVSVGITRLSSSLQELGLVNDKQADMLMSINAIIGVAYGSLLVLGALKALFSAEAAAQTAMAIAETAETLAIPGVGVAIVAAAVGAVAGMYIGLNYTGNSMSFEQKEEISIQGGDISSGTRRRQLAYQLGGVT